MHHRHIILHHKTSAKRSRNAGDLLWTQPDICDSILSNLTLEQCVPLLTVNNTVFQLVLRVVYKDIYAEVLEHLIRVGTPQASRIHSCSPWAWCPFACV